MADWPPEKTEILADADGAMNTLYLWRIPKPLNRTEMTR